MAGKKLIYVPGLISLIGIPIIVLLFKPVPGRPQTCISLYLPSDKMPSKETIPFSKYLIYQEIKRKKLLSVSMNDADIHQNGFLLKAKKNFIIRELERLTFTGDTCTVLSIELGNHTTFGDFVWLLNQAELYHLRRYALADSHFFFLTASYRQAELPHSPMKLLDL